MKIIAPNLTKGAFTKVRTNQLARLPIPKKDSNSRHYDEIVKLVDTMLQLQQQKQQTTLATQQEQLAQRITYTDDKINKLVYELYGLSEEEVKVVEGRL